LADCPSGNPLQITRVLDQNPHHLRDLEQQGLTPGTKLTIVTRDNYGGQLSCLVAGKTVNLDHASASLIQVSPL